MTTKRSSRIVQRLCVLLPCVLVLAGLRAAPNSVSDLRAENPEGYLELGELLAAQAPDQGASHRARQVLALGAGLAQRRGDAALAASCCIALASQEADDPERARMLWDLALLLDPSRLQAWSQRRAALADAQDSLRKQAARCLYHIRNGDVRDAAPLYERADVRSRIRLAAQNSGHQQPDRFMAHLDEMIVLAQDDDCRGRVFVRQAQDGEAVRYVCPDHARPIGTTLSDELLGWFVRIELALLDPDGGAQGLSGWEVSGALGRTDPLADPSLAQVLDFYGVDLTRPHWRGGAWAARP